MSTREEPDPSNPGVAPRLATALAATLVLVAGLVPAAGSPLAAPAAAADGTRSVGSSFDAQVVRLTNAQRAKRGLRPLRAVECTKRFAYRQSKRMAARDRIHHQSLRPVMRKCRARTAGENVAHGASGMSARSVVRRWMSSPGHRRNILAAKYRYVGVDAWGSTGSGRVYVSQVLGG